MAKPYLLQLLLQCRLVLGFQRSEIEEVLVSGLWLFYLSRVFFFRVPGLPGSSGFQKVPGSLS